MSLAITYSRASSGVHAPCVTVETHISNGLPSFSIVGLPETTVKESKDRVRSALMNTHFDFPIQRITVNLAPADLPKEGGRFDLPIALGILAASKQIPTANLSEYEFAGELGLAGEIRPIKGTLPFSIATRNADRTLIIPFANAEEAALISNIKILPARHILEVCAHLTGHKVLEPFKAAPRLSLTTTELDISEVRGQQHAKRALEVAAAGGHSLLMFGSPGTGKSMLATRLPTILPKMNDEEAIEVASITSISSIPFIPENWHRRPFRSPHHTASSVALVGGGSPPRPGEISLAHHGVLFLDELPEFDRKVLEALREPLESGIITISRAAKQAEFPAKFQLVAAMNPCPCGYLGDPHNHCRCTQEQVQRYRGKISGPLLDRIDLHIEVSRLASGVLTNQSNGDVETSAVVRGRVEAARKLQFERYGKLNAELSAKQLEHVCKLNARNREFLELAIKQLNLSARAYHRILRITRTIADLDHKENIEDTHLKEALNYRIFDRKPCRNNLSV